MKRPGWAKGGTRVRWRLSFEPRDLWRGLYWDYQFCPMMDENGFAYAYQHKSHSRLTLYFIAIPMIVLRIQLIAKEQTNTGKVAR